MSDTILRIHLDAQLSHAKLLHYLENKNPGFFKTRQSRAPARSVNSDIHKAVSSLMEASDDINSHTTFSLHVGQRS
eukprot:5901224-Pleurochrysis_carterae.AAC.3